MPAMGVSCFFYASDWYFMIQLCSVIYNMFNKQRHDLLISDWFSCHFVPSTLLKIFCFFFRCLKWVEWKLLLFFPSACFHFPKFGIQTVYVFNVKIITKLNKRKINGNKKEKSQSNPVRHIDDGQINEMNSISRHNNQQKIKENILLVIPTMYL